MLGQRNSVLKSQEMISTKAGKNPGEGWNDYRRRKGAEGCKQQSTPSRWGSCGWRLGDKELYVFTCAFLCNMSQQKRLRRIIHCRALSMSIKTLQRTDSQLLISTSTHS